MSSGVFDAGSIVGALKLDVDPYAQSMLRATSIAKAFPDVLTTYLTNPMLAAGQAITNLGSSFVGMFTDVAAHGDAMGELAASVGVAVEEMTALGEAASLSGSSTQGVADAYRFLGKSVSEAMASATSDAAKTFDSLGVSFLTAQGQAWPLSDVMLDLADAFKALPEGGARTTAAMSLLGRSGTELVPTLIQGKKALAEQMEQMKLYGVAVSASAADSSGRWNDSMDEMKLAYQGLKNTLAEAVQPLLLPYLERLTDWTRSHQPQIRKSIEDTVHAIGEGFKSLGPVFDFISDHWRQFASVAGGVAVYLAGPAVLGLIMKLGPAIFAVVEPLGAVRLAIQALKGALEPSTIVTTLFSTALGALTAYVIAQPGALKQLHAAWGYVAAVGKYAGDVFNNVVAPAIGQAMSAAFAHLQPYMPTTAELMKMLGQAGAYLHAQFDRVVTFVTGSMIPAIGKGLGAAFEWVGPKLHYVGDLFMWELSILQDMAGWMVGPGFDAIGRAFAGAWDYLGQAAESAAKPFEYVGGVIGAVVGWISQTAVPAITGAVGTVWGIVQPFFAALSESTASYYNDFLWPLVGWFTGTAVPAVWGALSALWAAGQPIREGMWATVVGLWDLGKGVTSWLVGYAMVVFQGSADIIRFVTGVIRGLFDMAAWGWTNVLQPIVAWSGSVVMPMLQQVGNVVGWLLEKVGSLLSWLGKVIDISGDATAAVNKVPTPAGAPALPHPLAAATPATAAPWYVPPPPATPAVDENVFFQNSAATSAAKAGAAGTVDYLKSAFKDLKMPTLQMPHVDLASLGRLGANSGVEPLADRFADLRRGAAAVVDGSVAAKQRGLPGGINGTSTADRTAAERTGGPTINVSPPPPLDENKLATAIASEVLKGNNRMLDQAIAAGQAARFRQDVSDGL